MIQCTSGVNVKTNPRMSAVSANAFPVNGHYASAFSEIIFVDAFHISRADGRLHHLHADSI